MESENQRELTFIKSFLGCFLSNLLQATIADLLEPVSNASIARAESNGLQDREPVLTVDGAYLAF